MSYSFQVSKHSGDNRHKLYFPTNTSLLSFLSTFGILMISYFLCCMPSLLSLNCLSCRSGRCYLAEAKSTLPSQLLIEQDGGAEGSCPPWVGFGTSACTSAALALWTRRCAGSGVPQGAGRGVPGVILLLLCLVAGICEV